MKLEDYYTIEEVAELLNITKGRAGLLKVEGKIKLTSRLLYPKKIIDYLKENRKKAGRPKKKTVETVE